MMPFFPTDRGHVLYIAVVVPIRTRLHISCQATRQNTYTLSYMFTCPHARTHPGARVPSHIHSTRRFPASTSAIRGGSVSLTTIVTGDHGGQALRKKNSARESSGEGPLSPLLPLQIAASEGRRCCVCANNQTTDAVQGPASHSATPPACLPARQLNNRSEARWPGRWAGHLVIRVGR